MIGSEDLSSRHTVPRWRSLRLSNADGERGSLRGEPVSKLSKLLVSQSAASLAADFTKKRAAWKASNDSCDAEELVTTGLLSQNENDPDVLTAAMQIASDTDAGPGMREFAGLLLDGFEQVDTVAAESSDAEVRKEIAERKRLLLLNPRDGLRAAETALLYSNLGQFDAARRLLERALKTHPHDRYVLRSAARFFTHVREPDVAVYHLSKTARSQADPWLSSALMAVAAVGKLPISNWKSAKSLLKAGNFSDFDNSELAAQLGSLEFAGGSRSRSIKFLRQSALDPTENAIAQIEWVSRQTRAFSTEEMVQDVSVSHEATANANFWQKDWARALAACDRWHALEPFSVRPSIFASYIATLSAQQLDRGIAMAKSGLRANPGERTLWNNIAVMYAYQSEVELAHSSLEHSIAGSQSYRETPVALATSGLIEIRTGNVEQGVELYKRAIDRASELKDTTSVVRAYAFLTREVARLDASAIPAMAKELNAAILKCNKYGVRVPQDVIVLKSELDDAQLSESDAALVQLEDFALANRIAED